ncbi:MAG: DUF2786 domain-containing protein [Myxococcales bacterium]|nr:DUF2786 domain-containing protein [Myxococcales bacterium]
MTAPPRDTPPSGEEPQLGFGAAFTSAPASGAATAPGSGPAPGPAPAPAHGASGASGKTGPAPAPGPTQAAEPQLTAELEAALLRELRMNYDWENSARFRNRLRPPVFSLTTVAGRWGRWVSASRTLELSRKLVLTHLWPEVLGVMLHEMAHQFVDEVLRASESAHGEVFQKVCAERGIDGKAAGPPVAATPMADGADPQGGSEISRVLDRIRKLLALAGSSNQHEAEIAMRKAHELMLRHNIESTRARTYEAYDVAHLGDPEKRGNRVEDSVMVLLTEYFFVKVIRIPVYLPLLGKRGHVFELSGTRHNLEMAKHVYHFLLATAERLWRANRGDARVTSGRDRLAYQSGVIRGFHEKLKDERTELKETGLVWVGDAQLDSFYHLRHPRIVSRRSTLRRNEAHDAGREAGRTIVLHRPIEHGSTSAGGRKLLRD